MHETARGREIIWNLCDRSIGDIEAYKDRCQGEEMPRIQLGSYSCGNYFEKFLKHFLELKKGEFDLVVPTLPEHRVSLLDSKEFRQCCQNARQLVVNDFGLLDKLSSHRYEIRMGRLFFKDYRDHRYEEYDASNYCGKATALLDFVMKQGFSVVAIESDIITKKYSLQLPKGISAYFHFPYRQISMSHICEFAAINKNIDDKFIPDDDCDLQCLNVYLEAKRAGYFKMGRNVYDSLDDSYLSNNYWKENMILSSGWFKWK